MPDYNYMHWGQWYRGPGNLNWPAYWTQSISYGSLYGNAFPNNHKYTNSFASSDGLNMPFGDPDCPLVVMFPDEWGTPLRFDLGTPYPGTVTALQQNIAMMNPLSTTSWLGPEYGFGKYADANGRYYGKLGQPPMGGDYNNPIPYRVYLTEQAIPGTGCVLYIYDSVTASPTIAPPSGSGPYPQNATITSSAGTITYKIFTPGDPVEGPTPGQNGWSATAASPVIVAMNTNQELRACAINPPSAPSDPASAIFT